jgi:hypothetical protein
MAHHDLKDTGEPVIAKTFILDCTLEPAVNLNSWRGRFMAKRPTDLNTRTG